MGCLKRKFRCGAIFCFIFTTSVVVSEMQLLTKSSVEAKCGDTLTLECKVSYTDQTDFTIVDFKWLHDKKSDDSPATNRHVNSQVQNKTSLFGNITNITPDDEGEYICKMYSNHGSVNAKTKLTVNCCFGSSEITANASHLTCQFKGVYPTANVLWFQGQKNLTAASNDTKQTKNRLYDYISTLSIEEGNQDQPYSCSLSRSSPCQDVTAEKRVPKGGTVTLQGNTFVIEMMMMMMTLMW